MHHHIAILGGTTFDHIIYLDELPKALPTTIHRAGFIETIGSTGAGKALAFTKLGLSNTLYSVAGNDQYGQFIKEFLASEQVDNFIETDPAGTERHVNIMDKHGNRISVFVTTSSENINHNEAFIRPLLERSSAVVLNIIPYCRSLIPLIKEYGLPVWTDLHDYDGSSEYHQDFIDASQYIHLSSDNLGDYRTVMEKLISTGKELVVCTHGKNGASLLSKSGEWIDQPAIAGLNIADANGAGDCFFAGFVYAFLQQKTLRECMFSGAICGGYAVTAPGLVYPGLSGEFVEQKMQE